MLEIDKYDKIIASNWKLNGSFNFINRYFDELKLQEIDNLNNLNIFCPPSIYIEYLTKKYQNLNLGAQECSNYKEGAYTGEISANMLQDTSCKFCLVGHSERRQIFNQTNKDIKIKINNLISCGINPIVCIGETLDQKNNDLTKKVLLDQITNSIPKIASSKTVILAYEPIWAIGTGLTPSLKEIEDTHSFVKNEKKYFENYKILYGGSVNSSNASDIMNLDNVDGVLVGGASLNPLEFKKILIS